MRSINLSIFFVVIAASVPALGAVVLERVISREHPLLYETGRSMTVGRDGKVYVNSGIYLLRMNPDGTEKIGVQIGAGLQRVATDTRGNIAALRTPHRGRHVAFYDVDFGPLGSVGGFLNDGEYLSWGSPSDVQSGESGKFYALDQFRARILCMELPGKTIKEYPLQNTGQNFTRAEPQLGVCESRQRFYIAVNNQVHAVSFDGKLAWTIPAKVVTSEDGFDVDDQGNVYVLNNDTDTIKVSGPDGKPSESIHLQMSEQLTRGRRAGEYAALKLFGDEVFLKRHRLADPTELFQVYDRKTGSLKRIIYADAERVKVEFPSNVWTAGETVPVKISLRNGAKTTNPNWPVQMALCNSPEWTSLPVVNGKVTPPTNAAGLYAVRIGYGEYRLETLVEIRQPGTQGTVNILTPRNRIYYGRGEEIPVTITFRGSKPKQIRLELRMNGVSIWNKDVASTPASPTVQLTAKFTSALRPGKYLLTADAPGFTVAPQLLVIGPGLRERPLFSIVQGGDGGGVTADGDAYQAPEELATYISNMQRLGANMIMSRAGYMKLDRSTGLESLVKQLEKDPLGIAPEKAQVENMALQTVAANGAFGIEQQMILLHMDTLVPFLPEGEIGPGGMLARTNLSSQSNVVQTISQLLLPYPAFRGWSWACNWWIYPEIVFGTDGHKAWNKLVNKYENKRQLDPELSKLNQQLVSVIPETERSLNAVLQAAAPGKVNAATGPYRQPWIIPPITFRDVAEVDLFLQAEQIQPPYTTPHNVDFYKRPGKRAWGHVDAGGEDGLGYMAPSIILMQAMRGADGTGWEGPFQRKPSGRRGTSTSGMDNDVRSTGQGAVSTLRALSILLRQYGPWLTTLESNDHIAIVVSTNMLRVDNWNRGVVGAGEYFNRLFEAYTTCLFAHRPASFVFTEDVDVDKLKQFKAVLVVNQQLELDPPLATALSAARDAGVAVLFDGTCREEHVREFNALNVAFDQLEQDPHLMNDDSVYQRLPHRYREQAAALVKRIGNMVPPVAVIDNAEIMLSERRNGEGRFVWVLNNDLPDWEPGVMWRVGNFSTNRVDQRIPVDLNAKGKTVYDMFSLKEVKDEVVADLRQVPARLFAVLPSPIKEVKLAAPAKIKAGHDFKWKVAVDGPKMSYPLQVRLLDETGDVIEESFPTDTSGTMTVPFNAGEKLTLEVKEWICGKSAEVSLTVEGYRGRPDGPRKKSATTESVESLYGPHLRDIAVSTDGSTALVNAMNWQENYYLLDTANGKVRTQGNVGHQFAYGPVAAGKGFFVQGYDVTTGEGYHLYDLGADGKPTRRFALYGLPDRWQIWRAMGILTDRVNNFVVSPKGDWIATASNLGLIVWNKNGTRLWSQDWWKDKRREVYLLRPDETTLVTLADMVATAYQATTGKKLWEVKLAETGLLEGGAASADGRTLAAYSQIDSGRVYVLRDGKLINTLMVMADSLYLTPDGQHLLISVGGNELRWYATDGALEWAFRGDDYLIAPRISLDGKKIVVGSHIGTLYVLDDHGHKLYERDFGAVPVAAWLEGGELLVATWMGTVVRLDAHGTEKWLVRLNPRAESRLASIPAAENLPTLKAVWGNASNKPAALSPNLLTGTSTTVRMMQAQPPFSDQQFRTPTELLIDGHSKAPTQPGLSWTSLQGLDFYKMALEVETKQRLRVTGVTFVEDPSHPESWLRDMRLQVWDSATGKWVDGPYLLSDAAVHTHMFETPLEGTKFRFVGTGDMLLEWRWPMGNIRVGELVFHGESLGPAKVKIRRN